MSVSNSIISRPVAISDVMRCLGVYVPSLAYLSSNAHHRTNKWARYKPEMLPSQPLRDEPINDELRKANNFGLRPGTPFSTKAAFVAAARSTGVANGLTEWTYEPPDPYRGHAARLGDWDGYDHTAPCPFPYVNDSPMETNGSAQLSVPLYVPFTNRETSIDPSQLTGDLLREYYFGVLLYNSSQYMMATGTQPLKDLANAEVAGGGASGVYEIPLGRVSIDEAGTYSSVTFLSRNPIRRGDTTDSSYHSIIAIERGGSLRIWKLSEIIEVTIACLLNAEETSMNITVSVKNNRTSEVTLSVMKLMFATEPLGGGETYEDDISTWTRGSSNSVTIPAQGSVTVVDNALVTIQSIGGLKPAVVALYYKDIGDALTWTGVMNSPTIGGQEPYS